MGLHCSRNKVDTRFDGGVRLAFDPDEKWSNLYREREKNHLYRWVGVRRGGELISTYERDGERGVLRFVEEKVTAMMYNEGREAQLIKQTDYMKWKKSQVRPTSRYCYGFRMSNWGTSREGQTWACLGSESTWHCGRSTNGESKARILYISY